MADRDGKLRLDLVDVYGDRLGENVDVMLRHQTLSEKRVVKAVSASKRIRIVDLLGFPQGLYRVEVDPPAYSPVRHFIRLKASGFTDLPITFPVDPQKVAGVDFPAYQDVSQDVRTLLENSDAVSAFEGKKGEELYGALDNVRRAGLLNIATKAANTMLSNGKTVFPYIQKLNRLRGDRFFAVVAEQLLEEAENSVAAGLFERAPSILHSPPDGFSEAGSFKSDDRYGNLQLTFFVKGNEYVADIDIDDAAGLEHVFQVLRNWLTGRPTHPYDIHEILVYHQKLDPGYRFRMEAS